MSRNKPSLTALLLVAGAVVSAFAQRAPDPVALLDSVLAASQVPYQGHVMVTQWYGRQTRAEEMLVRVLPPDRVRREFLAPDGTVTRVLISNGDEESVRLVRPGKTIVGNAVHSDEKVIPAELERRTLLSNYELVSSTGEHIAGRPTWRLALRPKIDGKSWQTLWIDQETKVVLRTKRFQPKRPFASQAQFMSFEPRKPQDEDLFRIDDSTSGVIQARGLSPQFLTRDQLSAAAGSPTRLPERLPGGFIFESADVFSLQKSKVRHARYTDGLTVLSVFETDRPVTLPKNGAISPGRAGLPGPLRASLAGKILQWRVGRRYYTAMGDVSRELMGEIAKALR